MDDIETPIEPIPPIKVWTLDPPIHLGAKEYDSLTMRAPTLNEVTLTDVETSVLKQIKKMIQLVSGLPPAVVELIPFWIAREAYQYSQSFSSAGVAAYSAQQS